MYDVLIIGAGITGASIAMELSKYHLKVAWLEKHNDVAMETSRANSGIIHSGYDPKPGTQMAWMNVLGAKLFQELAQKLNIHYEQIGSLVIGRDQQDLHMIEQLYERGVANGVQGLQILRGAQLRAVEPNLNEDIQYALYSPSAAIISPWEACLAFAQTAVHNGVELFLNSKVDRISKEENGYLVHAAGKIWETKTIINCAGVYADEIFQMVDPSTDEEFTIAPVKGSYYLLDKSQGNLVNHVVFQTPGVHGKGVLVSRTVHGNLIVGPDADSNLHGKADVSVGSENLSFIRQAAQRTTGKINYRENVRNFAGLRAKIPGMTDFLIKESKENPGFINFAGIQSPGLSCGPAFGLRAVELLVETGLSLRPKDHFEYVPLQSFFKDMSISQINDKIKKNPLYGRIVCRCETVSEGEIVDAVHQIIGATTLDAVKRRTNAGMGRCQGGFCGPKVLEIIKRELGLPVTEIYQDLTGGYIAVSDRGDRND